MRRIWGIWESAMIILWVFASRADEAIPAGYRGTKAVMRGVGSQGRYSFYQFLFLRSAGDMRLSHGGGSLFFSRVNRD